MPTLIIEDGTKPANANTYVSLAEVDAYHEAYGNLDWAGDDATKEQAIINACRSLELLYGARFASAPSSNTQPLLFPRYAFADRYSRYHTGIPKELKDAQCEIALKALNGEDILPVEDESDTVLSDDVTIGPLSFSKSFAPRQQTNEVDGFRRIELILLPILRDEYATPRFAL